MNFKVFTVGLIEDLQDLKSQDDQNFSFKPARGRRNLRRRKVCEKNKILRYY